MTDLIQKIKAQRNIDCNTVNVIEGFIYIEGIQKNTGSEEKYMVYDCTNGTLKFNYELYKKKNDEKEVGTISIIAFKNWHDEMRQYLDVYNISEAKMKKELKKLFDSKISVYTDTGDTLSLIVTDSENYLEHQSNENEAGYIYDLNFFELKKLFSVRGEILFEKNIRNHIENTAGKDLKTKFNNYICIGLFEEITKTLLKDDEKENELLTLLDIDRTVLEDYCPKNFWFCHNGITIYSYNENKIRREGNEIVINPCKVSVINGAQTINNFFKNLELVKNRLQRDGGFSDIVKGNMNLLDNMLDNVCKRIIVKTIFIEGNENSVHFITNGLNTQIPIMMEDIEADSEEVAWINKIIRNGSLEIVKPGYTSALGTSLSVMQFTKFYEIIRLNPGKSKNLKKQEIKNILKEACRLLEKEEHEKLVKNFTCLVEVDKWWSTSRKDRQTTYTKEEENVINSYAKNYFESYLIYNEKTDIDLEYMMVTFDEFMKKILKVEPNPKLGDFKSDDLFNRYMEENEIIKKSNTPSELTLNNDEIMELRDYLNENVRSQYSVSKTISEYLSEKSIALDYFRVLTKKHEKYAEAFPFQSSTFNELVYTEISQEDVKDHVVYLDFDKSAWYDALTKKYPVFIIEKAEEKSWKAEKIEVYNGFSFVDFLEDAKKVYYKTVNAFKMGDINEFPKSSDKMSFHVRPKAMDADDTFEFTNGDKIVKRTFWANKDTVEKIINKLMKLSGI